MLGGVSRGYKEVAFFVLYYWIRFDIYFFKAFCYNKLNSRWNKKGGIDYEIKFAAGAASLPAESTG